MAYLKKLFVLVLGIGMAFVSAELLLRLLPSYRLNAITAANVYNDPGTRRLCRYSDLFGYELTPNAEEGINRFGMRDDEYPLRKPRGMYRILVLGDSITEYGKWSTYLEAHLNRNGKYEVLNGAVRGWGLFQYHAYVRSKAPAFRPDLILMGLCLNDVEAADVVHLILTDKGSDTVASYFLKGGMQRDRRIRNVNFNRFLFHHSYVYRFVFGTFILTRNLARELDNSADSASEKLREAGEMAHGQVLAVVFPYLKPLDRYTAYEKKEYAYTLAALRNAGIDFLDLTDHFNRYGGRIAQFRETPLDQIHFNDAANRIKADLIYRWLWPRIRARQR